MANAAAPNHSDYSARLAALPTLAPGLSVALLRRCWFALPADQRHQRASLLTSMVHVTGRGLVELASLSVAEVEGIIGAVTPRFVVRFFDPRKTGTQVATFVVESDAHTFAAGKKFRGEPAKVVSL